jgi:antitoxin YobK
MSLQDYEKARELIAYALRRPGLISTFVGPKPETLVNSAEERLSVKFPETYRRFLLDYGAGGLGSFEIYGLIQEDFENHGYLHLDVVWLTKKERTASNLPQYLLPIFDLGDGEIFCLDLRHKEGNEAQVVGFTPGYSTADQSLDVVAEDFGELLLDQVQLTLNITKGG